MTNWFLASVDDLYCRAMSIADHILPFGDLLDIVAMYPAFSVAQIPRLNAINNLSRRRESFPLSSFPTSYPLLSVPMETH